jgi:hypothetical protein
MFIFSLADLADGADFFCSKIEIRKVIHNHLRYLPNLREF